MEQGEFMRKSWHTYIVYDIIHNDLFEMRIPLKLSDNFINDSIVLSEGVFQFLGEI